ncbi:MAG: ArsR family transcriptional regulator [Thermogladius sp.]|jgi:signal transduction histidine kinase|uniref:ArsR family transcriptional regulator n=1 Tax=Thermogladius calderae TaxID=1200300 RepID=A0A7J3Y010_9CREN|nr:ArsR family transcriptional regulator [Thermogladius sp.]
MVNVELSPEELERLSRKVRLRILHEDDDVVLMTAPNEEQLVNIIYELLQEKPLNLKEVHLVLSGIASEDKIRRAVSNLVENGLIITGPDGRYRAVPA